MQMANLAGDKSWPRKGLRWAGFSLSSSSYLRLSSSQFAQGGREPPDGWLPLEMSPASQSVCLSLPFLLSDFASKFAVLRRRLLLFHVHYGNRSLRGRGLGR